MPCRQPGVESSGAEIDLRHINGQIAFLESQIKVKDNEIANYEKQKVAVEASLNTLNSRVLSMPVGDQRLTELLRDESMAKDEYSKS